MRVRGRLGRVIPGAPGPGAAATPGPRAGGTTGKMKRARPPNVAGRGPLLAERGFGVVLVCIVKDEADYLEEWLGFHVALGVDHFLVYDNGSSDGSAALLERYQNHGLVTRIDWPLGGGQLAAYNHALRFFGASCDWMAFFDVDEFLVPLVDDDIRAFLSRFGDAADVRVPRIEFGYSGHRTPPPGLAIDSYTQVANVLDLDPALPPRVKSIVQPWAISAVDIHLAFPADEPAPGRPTETAETTVRGIAQLNHYYTRSFEEFEAKRFRGSATGRIARPAVPFDLPTLATDNAAQRYSERTLATMTWLRELEPRPYTYGSQLALDHFPRPNDLGRFAEFAIANTAAGLPEPSRVAAARVRNLHDGVGLVADLADTGFEPGRGKMAGSVHTAALIEHMRGRLDADLGSDPAPGRFMTLTGSLLVPDVGSALLDIPSGAAEVLIALPPDRARRCYSLGFVVGCEAPVRLEAMVERSDGSMGEPIAMELPASPCVAGIVEIEPAPQHAARASLRVETATDALAIHDLFVISTG